MSHLDSPRWHRVAELRPALPAALRVRRQRVRGETWIVLGHPSTGRHVRLNAAAWALVGRFDGTRTLDALWREALARDDDGMAEPGPRPGTLPWRDDGVASQGAWPRARLRHSNDADPGSGAWPRARLRHSSDDALASQDHWLDLLARLREAGLVELDRPAAFDALVPHLRAIAPETAGARSWLAWRLPLGDPGPLLDRFSGAGRVLFSTPALIAWACVITLAAIVAFAHAGELAAHAARWSASPRLALLTAVLFVPIKALHELAHGLATRARGGAVRAAGLTLMLGAPVPWVDASSAAAFPRARDRALVAAAGVMAELALASIALVAWLSATGEGLARDIAFATMAVAGVSTVLFNANPLQRLDGYHLATDLLGLPNLALRSRRWWHDRLLAVVRGREASSTVEAMPVADGEAPWLAAYAPLAWAMTVAIVVLAVTWLGHLSSIAGLVAAAALAAPMLLRGPFSLARDLVRAARAAPSRSRGRARLVVGLAFAATAAIALVPLPRASRLPGVLWPAESAQLRADEDGTIVAVDLPEGALAQAGDAVLHLRNATLDAALARQAARVTALETATLAAEADPADPDAAAGARAGDARADLLAAQRELSRLRERADALVVRAAGTGRVALGPPEDLMGRWVRHGTLVGQLVGGEAPVVRVAWPEDDLVERLAAGTRANVRLASAPGEAHVGVLARDGAGAATQLPSAALSDRHGGPLATDPQDPQDLRAAQPVVLVDVRMDAAAPASRIGERAWVRVDAGRAPLAWQAIEGARRWIVRRFDAR